MVRDTIESKNYSNLRIYVEGGGDLQMILP